MKKFNRFCLLVSVIFMMLLTACILSSCGGEPTEVLYVYNWGEYISDGTDDTLDVNAEFEKYCEEVLGRKVKVNYSTFSSNESMYAKLSSGAASYDVIIPSDYMIERMISEDMLRPLDLSKIPNYQYVADEFKGDHVYYECGREETYSVPYFYGMVGIIYNEGENHVDPNDTDIGSWSLMWDPDYIGDILQFNNSRDAFGTAMYYKGYDVNNASKEEWMDALQLLKDQKVVIQGYVMDEIFNKMKSGSASVAAYYAGDYLSMHEDNNDLSFFYPKEGTNAYVDAMCIPKNCQNYDLALEYINFMCEEEIAVANAEYTYYASPLTTVRANEGYQETMAEVHEDAIEILYGEMAASVPTQAYLNLSPENLTLLNSLWEELKVESSIGAGIYMLCGVILFCLAALVIYQFLKKRRWAKLYD